MKRHGVFWCQHCGYRCPVKAPVNDFQRDLGYLDQRFWDLIQAAFPPTTWRLDLSPSGPWPDDPLPDCPFLEDS